MLLEALASGRMWGEAIAAADDAARAIPSRSMHRPILTWKAYCLAQSGRNVLSEMGKVRCLWSSCSGPGNQPHHPVPLAVHRPQQTQPYEHAWEPWAH